MLLTDLLNTTSFTASSTRFFAFSIDYFTRNLAYFKATNSGIAWQLINILKTTFSTVMNLLLTVVWNNTPFTASKSRFFAFSIDFFTRNAPYCKAINSGILEQVINILKTTFCTVMYLLLTVLLSKTPFTVSKTRFIAFSIDFFTRNVAYFKATNSGIL